MEYVSPEGLRLDGGRPMEICACVVINRDISGYSSNNGSIDIYVQVLQADGRSRSACINAATLALADAGIPMRDLVTSCAVGYLNSTPLLDLNYVEDSAGGTEVTVRILPKLDKMTLLQMDAKLPVDIFENAMQLAIEGCKGTANYIRKILLENTKQLEYRRGI